MSVSLWKCSIKVSGWENGDKILMQIAQDVRTKRFNFFFNIKLHYYQQKLNYCVKCGQLITKIKTEVRRLNRKAEKVSIKYK